MQLKSQIEVFKMSTAASAYMDQKLYTTPQVCTQLEFPR